MTRHTHQPIRFAFHDGHHDPVHGARHAPPVDVVADPGGWRLVFEIPGARMDTVALAIQGRVVCVKGHRGPTEGERGSFLRVERDAGPFERSVELPDEPDAEAARASYVDGLLTVEVPRRASSGSRTIPVHRTGARRG